MANNNTYELQDVLKSLGIGIDSDMANEIKQHIFNGQTSFCLNTDALFGESTTLRICVNFFKESQDGDYFLRDYRVTHHLPSDPTNDRTQTFDMTTGMRIHLKEAFNLLRGRSVFKEITPPKDEKYFA